MFVGGGVNHRILIDCSFQNSVGMVYLTILVSYLRYSFFRGYFLYNGLHHCLQTFHPYGVGNKSRSDDMFVGGGVNHRKLINFRFSQIP